MLPLLLALSPAGLAAPELPAVDDALARRLRGGEIVVDVHAAGTVIGCDLVAYVAHPPEEVWAVLGDYPAQTRWVPDLSENRVVSTNGPIAVTTGVAPVPFPLSDRTWTIEVHRRAEKLGGFPVLVQSWTLVPGGGNMVENSGYWLLRPWEGGTLVRYVFRADAGLSMPDFLEEKFTRGSMPKMIENLRRLLAAG